VPQGEQRRTYLAHQSSFTVVDEKGVVGMHVAEMKLADVAGAPAAPDASPAAAILLAISPPRGELAGRVAGDSSLELQQRLPLVWHATGAAAAAGGGGMGGRGKCGGSCCYTEEDQELGSGMHGIWW
jgi:hypothetical protein